MAKRNSVPALELEPIAELVARRVKSSKRRANHRSAMEWVKFDVPERQPFGIFVWGDEHLDDDGCDFASIVEHAALCRDNPGVYSIGVGDHHNNWIGRLMRLYAAQDASAATAWRLVEWHLRGAGINWLFRILGNHDKWGNGAELLQWHAREACVPVFDWAAAVALRMPNGREVRIRAAHNFKGHSQWNRTHGPLKAAMMTYGDADVYLCGHLHTAGIQQIEVRDRCPVALRVGSYKKGDDYALVNGFVEEKHDAAKFLIIDPDAPSQAGLVQAFYDVRTGIKVLNALRGETGKQGAPTARRSGRKPAAKPAKARRGKGSPRARAA